MAQAPDAEQLQAYLADVATTIETMRARIQHLESQAPPREVNPTPPTIPNPIESQFATLLQHLQSMTLTPSSSFTLPLSGNPPLRSEKHPDPSVYTGQAADLERFISQLNNKLEANADRYPTERERVIYAYSRLEGKAAQDLQGYFRPGSNGILTVNSFVEHLERRYGDPFKSVTARAAWLDLRQRNMSFTDFLTQFENLANIAGISDPQRMKEQLEHAMSREMKRHLIYQVPYPETFHALAARCSQIESLEKLVNRTSSATATATTPRHQPAVPTATRTETAMTRRPLHPTTQLISPTSPATGANATPVVERTTTHGGNLMDLSRNRGPLSQEEKQRRRDNNLCLYCGGIGHIARECPNRTTRIAEMELADLEVNDQSGKE